MGPAEPARPLAVTVAYSGSARQVDRVALSLPAGATVGDALRQSGLLERHSEVEMTSLKVGVWGKLRPLTDVLRDGDRVEVYRPLKVDPKEARRQRYRSHRDKVSAKR